MSSYQSKTIFPWQKDQWQQLCHAKQHNRLPHALLFKGIKGLGKAIFAEHFSRFLLCQKLSNDENYCNACHSCQLIEGRTHPNVLWVEPEKSGGAIKVDQIRLVSDFINQTALQGKFKIVIINPANQMNINAANALLKTLEEPSSNAVLILICDENGRLPATIISRCQRIIFSPPKNDVAVNWLNDQLANIETEKDSKLLLELANHAPLAALQLINEETLSLRKIVFDALHSLGNKQGDPVAFAATMQDIDLVMFVDFNLSWIADILRLQLSEESSEIKNSDYQTELQELKHSTQVKNNVELMEYLRVLRGRIMAGINFNKQLMFENILIRWMMTPCS